MAETSIQWCDHSVNPFRARNLKTGKVGHFCAKLSAGCKNCYSSKLQTPHLSGLPFLAENRAKVELFLEEKALQEVARRKKPTKYFWCDMTDMFWEEYPDEWIDRCVGVMAWTAHHTHMVLTKRSKRLMEYSKGLAALTRQQRGVRMARGNGFIVPDDTPGGMDWPLPNIWFMVSCEDQPTADERIGHLLRTPAAIRGVSYEPALSSVDFSCIPWPKTFPLGLDDLSDGFDALRFDDTNSITGMAHLDWVIVGGESGTGARPFDIQWARNAAKQCEAAGVAVFVKQLGAVPVHTCDRIQCGGCQRPHQLQLKDRKGGDMAEWPQDLRIRQFPEVRA